MLSPPTALRAGTAPLTLVSLGCGANIAAAAIDPSSATRGVARTASRCADDRLRTSPASLILEALGHNTCGPRLLTRRSV
jgi:hypothetical protein